MVKRDRPLVFDDFDSAWLKWGRAVVHSQVLNAEVETFAVRAHSEPLMTHRLEYHPKRHGFALMVDEVLIPFPASWGLILGDIANNFRSALDHVAWTLVARGRTPPDSLKKQARRKIGFPIKHKRTEFNGELPSFLPGVSRADIAIVRSYQPYLSGVRRSGLQAFALLAAINNADKHRTIHPIWDIPDTIQYEVTNQRDCVLSERRTIVKPQPMKPNTEVALIPVRKTGPNPHIEVKPHVMAQPALEQRVWLSEWLDNVCAFTVHLFWDLRSQPPQELEELNIDWARVNRLTGIIGG